MNRKRKVTCPLCLRSRPTRTAVSRSLEFVLCRGCRDYGDRDELARVVAALPRSARCRNCDRKLISRPRLLCATCHADASIRHRYDPRPGCARRGLGGTTGRGVRPALPTSAPPGSLAKMREMQRRIERGETVDHPGDNREVVRELCNPFAALPPWREDTPTGLEDETEPQRAAC